MSGRSSGPEGVPRLSVVLATYNRPAMVERLLRQLAQQTVPPEQFEVVVVDDGSREPVRERLLGLSLPYALTVEAQENRGAAAARHKGALLARGDILLITDDDMQASPELLARHLAHHEGAPHRVVLGRIRPDPELSRMPLFERWYAHRLEKMARAIANGALRPGGGHFFTGNVSLRRADYLTVGGFDLTLQRSEDLELGLRLEKAGVEIVFAEDAYTLHGSDHTDLDTFLRRAFLYGVFDSRIREKHPDALNADPWRFLFRFHPLARPLLLFATAAPALSRPFSGLAWRMVEAADRAGFERFAFAGSSVVYQMQYFRGVRQEAGSLVAAGLRLARYARARKRAAR